MASGKINKNLLRQRMAAKLIFSFAQLSREIGCTETAIHMAIERPSRFSRVVSKLMKKLDIAELAEITNESRHHRQEVAHV